MAVKKHSKQKPTVYVGMSGGVDSSVSAALLKKQGYNVVGVFIKAWEPEGFDCGWREDRRDAMRVAAVLDIPFVTLDLSKEYKQEVVDYMIAEYQTGRTPNPDVMCNQAIKFGGFFRKAREMGADFVATGHYARVRAMKNVECRMKNKENAKYEMLAGVDKNKDQTYFLWTLNQEHLAHTLFPVGGLEKPEVRQLAAKFKLPTQAKKDSQGLCFIGKLDIKDFLKNYLEQREGDVLNEQGEVIGRHPGALFFTTGERHGFTVFKKSPDEKPLYIIAKDIERNTITVSAGPAASDQVAKTITLRNISWTLSEEPDFSKTYSARVRYREPLKACQLRKVGQEIELIFDEPETFVAAGQSAVIYDGEICLGGGIIV